MLFAGDLELGGVRRGGGAGGAPVVARGVKRGDRVGWWRQPRGHVLALGLARIGAIMVPINRNGREGGQCVLHHAEVCG
jgi:hypothetical protein